MIKKTILVLLLFLSLNAIGQKQRYFSAAAFTTQSDYPFGKFAGLFREIYHPGFEIGYGKILKPKIKHEWTMELKFAYFYHRYVQHGMPLYFNFGYRYKFTDRIAAETSIGAGYMHSIPATGKFKLNDDGEYANNKGVGRMQAQATFAIGASYLVKKGDIKSPRLFTSYQQRVQMPFVKSYVPLLPYNSFYIGITKPLQNKSTKSKK
jgi:hypothetical protein